jgi:hypothetical protein
MEYLNDGRRKAMLKQLLVLGALLAAPAWGHAQLPAVNQRWQEENRQYSPERLAQSWYGWYLRRAPAQEEWVPLARELHNGRPPAELLSGLLAGQEYWNYSGGTRAGFLTQLILDVGHHQPTLPELNDWMRRTQFASRTDIAYSFLLQYPQNWVPGLPGSGVSGTR